MKLEEAPDAWDDPIVAEVRAIREQMLADSGGDLDALFAMLKASESARGSRVVSRPPRRPDSDAA